MNDDDDDDGCDDGKIWGKEVNLNGIWGEMDIRGCMRDALNSPGPELEEQRREVG